jgi:hypothetical protein
MSRNLVLAATLLLTGGALFATPIAGVCGTGFAANCGAQINATSGLPDGNFTLISNANGTGTTAYVTNNSQFPIPPWLADTATGEWIGPALNGNENTSDTVGNFFYQESFSLAGLDPTSATISGFWAVDNNGCIFLNGTNTGDCINGTAAANYSVLTAFSIVNGQGGATFNAGANTIVFETVNTASMSTNPTGVFVEMSGTANLLGAVPEPASFAFVGLGLAAIGLVRRRLRF